MASTVDQRNAVFNVLERDANALVQKYAHGFIENMAEQQLAAHRADLLQIAIDCADACEAARPK